MREYSQAHYRRASCPWNVEMSPSIACPCRAMHECIGGHTRDAAKFTAYREARLREAGVSEETIVAASSAATAKLMG